MSSKETKNNSSSTPKAGSGGGKQNGRTIPILPEGWTFEPKVRTDGETIDLYWRSPSGEQFRAMSRLREELDRLGIEFKTRYISMQDLIQFARKRKKRPETEGDKEKTEKETMKKLSSSAASSDVEVVDKPEKKKEKKTKKTNQKGEQKSRTPAAVVIDLEADDNVRKEPEEEQSEEKQAPAKKKESSFKRKLDTTSEAEKSEGSTNKNKRKSSSSASSSLPSASQSETDSAKRREKANSSSASPRKQKQDSASAVSSPPDDDDEKPQKLPKTPPASQLPIGPRIGALMGVNDRGNWVVSLIGRHTVQITGPVVGPTGAWYTVRPAQDIKEVPIHSYMYKFRVPPEFMHPSVHAIDKEVNIGQIALTFKKKSE